jgi:iron complex outermembrane receptor protein
MKTPRMPCRRNRRLLACACAGAIAPWNPPVQAQNDAAPADKPASVVITGSNIARVEGESGLPVQVITREELQHGGVQTMQELLERISANQSFGGSNPALGVNSSLVGFTAASLRGLGSQRTLVLLNGRRLAPYALSGGQSVDLSAIPASAIERVEILKDGASAIYGTDAIGGVMNFILRENFSGVEFNADYLATQQGGGNNGRVSLTAGTGDLTKDKYNVFVSASYFQQQALRGSQRESTKTSYLPGIGVEDLSWASSPANIYQIDPFSGETYGFEDFFNPTIPYPGKATARSCAPPYAIATVGQPTLCQFDYPAVADTIPASEQANVIGRLTWDIDPETRFFVEGSYYRGRFTQSGSPTPVLYPPITSTEMTLPPTSPYYPSAFVAGLPGGRPDLPIGVLYRTVELGPRVDEATVEQWNGVVGLQGTLRGWSYRLVASGTNNRQVGAAVSGYVLESKFGPLLRSGVVNPFGPNTPEVLAMMRAAQVTGPMSDNRASNVGAALTVSSSVFELPAGPAAFAAGIEARRESLRQSLSDFDASGDVLGGGGAWPSLDTAQRNVFSLFGELNLPLAKDLELNLAARYDDYSDFGGTTNPKLTLRWQPSRTLLLRAAYGTGYRAPTLSDLHQPQSAAPALGLEDPVRCPVTGDFYDCDGGFLLKEGGNPALEPETSQQVNAGIVFEPAAGWSASIDYYWVRLKNVVNLVPAETILGPDHAAWASGYVVRKPPDALHPGLPGRIDYVVQYPTNVGTLTTSGIDLNLQWRGPATAFGRFSLALNGTYVLDYAQGGYESAGVPAAGARNPLGVGAIARYRQYAQLNWAYGPWGATLANNYQDGYSEPCKDEDPSGCSVRRVGSYSVWDLQGRYSGLKNTTLTLGVRNALDKAPPLSNQTEFGRLQKGFDPSYADPRGRMFYAALSLAFD